MSTAFLMLMRLALGFLLLVVAFWPGFGLAYGLGERLRDQPVPWTVLIGLWSILLTLCLPFSANAFRRISTVAVAVIFGAIVVWLWVVGFIDAAQGDTMVKILITLAGVLLGWWVVAPMIYRWFRRIHVVDESAQLDE